MKITSLAPWLVRSILQRSPGYQMQLNSYGEFLGDRLCEASREGRSHHCLWSWQGTTDTTREKQKCTIVPQSSMSNKLVYKLQGYFMRPTVITNISDSSPAMTEEIFGTIHCIITVMVIIQCRSCCMYCTVWFWRGGKNFVIRKLSNGSYCCFHRLFRGLILYHMD